MFTREEYPMRRLMLIGLTAAQAALATTTFIVPQKAAIDRAFDAALRGERRKAALEMMEGIAEGNPRAALQELATKAGLASAIDAGLPTDRLQTRRYALEKIGETGLPEAIQYLQALTDGHAGPDDTRTIYPAAKLALQKALFRRETQPQRQIEFLERKISTEPTGFSVAMWAVDELCDRGSASSTAKITAFVKRRYSGTAGDEMVAFCLARMDIVNSAPSRAAALGSALRTEPSLQGYQLVSWAIGQLAAMRSPEADAVLDRFASELEAKLPDVPAVTSVAQNQIYRGFAAEIRRAQAERARK